MRKGRYNYEEMQPPVAAREQLPDFINVYPDCGLTSPTNQHLGLAAAGIFGLKRYADEDGDDNEERARRSASLSTVNEANKTCASSFRSPA